MRFLIPVVMFITSVCHAEPPQTEKLTEEASVVEFGTCLWFEDSKPDSARVQVFEIRDYDGSFRRKLTVIGDVPDILNYDDVVQENRMLWNLVSEFLKKK